MSLLEVEREALKLADKEKADLVCKLLKALPLDVPDVSDEEIAERERRLEQGEIEELSQDEFVRRVQSTRGR